MYPGASLALKTLALSESELLAFEFKVIPGYRQ